MVEGISLISVIKMSELINKEFPAEKAGTLGF